MATQIDGRGRPNYRPQWEPDPWERQFREPPSAYEAFKVYRDLGPTSRSQKAVAEHEPRWRNKLVLWSRTWRWIDRVSAWDQMVERRKVESTMREIEQMAARHVNTALLLQQKALERLSATEAKELNMKDIDRWIERGIAIERQARGQPDPARVQINLQQNQQQIAASQSTAATLGEISLRRYIEDHPDELQRVNTAIDEALALPAQVEAIDDDEADV